MTTFALDSQGLPDVIYTSQEECYLHLPTVILTKNSLSQTRYFLGDGLGSIRQAIDATRWSTITNSIRMARDNKRNMR